MPTSLGPAEILVILVVALIVLGPNRLPSAARQVGKAFSELRRWSTGMQGELRDAFEASDMDPEPMPPPAYPPLGPEELPKPVDLEAPTPEPAPPAAEPPPPPAEDAPRLGPLGMAMPPMGPRPAETHDN